MATSAARPKRAAEEFARTQEASSKKPRFDARNPSTLAADAPEDDLILNADVIGKSGAQTKRNAVNIDGYESDSDNDNFNERAELRDKAQRHQANGAAGVSKDEDDDDMFAEVEEAVQGTADGDDDEELTREGTSKKKDVRFLDEAEIEGQVASSKSGGRVSGQILLGRNGKKRAASVSSSSSSGDEEERDILPDEDDEDAVEVGAGGKKKHAPRLDAFNLKDEAEEGKFDESGNFVRKAADPDAVNDRWLEGLSKKDMKKAREAQEKRDQDQRRKTVKDDALLTSDLLSTLIQHLEVGETPLEALQRLNKGRQKEPKIPKWKRKRQGEMDIDGDANGDSSPAETARKQAVEAVTGAADVLYSRGQGDIYDEERELLLRQFKRETGDEWQPPAQSSNGADSWEYRWSDARDGGAHHGPYDAPTMKAWSAAGYFGEGVEFRRIGDVEWSRLLDVQ